MLFIATYWWVWGVCLILSVTLLLHRMSCAVKSPSLLEGNGIRNTFLFFVPTWTFAVLMFISVIVNIVLLIKA